jgi:hypothetical protein
VTDFPKSAARPALLHVICDRDVGLFSLVLSVIAHVNWAMSERRLPIVYYREGNCYWTPNGYRDRNTVWEYYFEPVIPEYPASSIPPHIRKLIRSKPPVPTERGYFADEFAFVSNHSGADIEFDGERGLKSYGNPSDRLRQATSAIIRDYVRPRVYIKEKVDRFFGEHLADRPVIGVHIRGTDSLVDPHRLLKESQIHFQKYFALVEQLLRTQPNARIFVCSDAQSSVDRMRERFGNRVIAYDSIRHERGHSVGRGPTGRIMPAYLTQDPDRAAKSGEEAIIEYLLLCRCNYLVHNGSGFAQTVLLTVPNLPACNALSKLSPLRRAIAVWRHRIALVRETISGRTILS